jgi:hypothetical protein
VSTKNLARTVIEGGRRFYNSWERRHSHAEVRAAERVVASLARDGDADELLWPEPKCVPRSFHDKLSAAERWLFSHVGRPWRLVRSEISAQFDVRTLAGQHIVFDHLLPRRRDRDGTWHVDGYVRFRVDRHGILRAETRRRRPPRSKRTPAEWEEDRRADALADGRKVVRHGTRLYWGVRVAPLRDDFVPRYRQARALAPDERARFEALSPAAQERILLWCSA